MKLIRIFILSDSRQEDIIEKVCGEIYREIKEKIRDELAKGKIFSNFQSFILLLKDGNFFYVPSARKLVFPLQLRVT